MSSSGKLRVTSCPTGPIRSRKPLGRNSTRLGAYLDHAMPPKSRWRELVPYPIPVPRRHHVVTGRIGGLQAKNADVWQTGSISHVRVYRPSSRPTHEQVVMSTAAHRPPTPAPRRVRRDPGIVGGTLGRARHVATPHESAFMATLAETAYLRPSSKSRHSFRA